MLLFNVCVLSYQTQQYGKLLQHANMILQYKQHVEDFIILKLLFLILQVLFELRMPQPAWPILHFLVSKAQQMQETSKTLKLIQDAKTSAANTNTFSPLTGHTILPNLTSPKRCGLREFSALLHHHLSLIQAISP